MEEETAEPRKVSVQEYLQAEYASAEKHEYYSGLVVAMAGGSPMRALICANAIAALSSRLRGKPCRVFTSDLRVRVPEYPTYVYPDTTVVCGPLEHDVRDNQGQTITNPKLVVEVESPSTESRDWSAKLIQYVSVPSLEEYVVISQKSPIIYTLFRREEGTWLLTPFKGTQAMLKLCSLEIETPLAEIYEGVEFPPAPVDAP